MTHSLVAVEEDAVAVVRTAHSEPITRKSPKGMNCSSDTTLNFPYSTSPNAPLSGLLYGVSFQAVSALLVPKGNGWTPTLWLAGD